MLDSTCTIAPMTKGETYSRQFTVTDDVYAGFMRIFNDKNPLHTDSAFARSKKFDDVVMHGNILGGFLSYFIGECLPVKNVIIHSQELKYYKPVYLNQTLNFTATVCELVEAVQVVILDFIFRDMSGLKIAKGKIQIGLI